MHWIWRCDFVSYVNLIITTISYVTLQLRQLLYQAQRYIHCIWRIVKNKLAAFTTKPPFHLYYVIGKATTGFSNKNMKLFLSSYIVHYFFLTESLKVTGSIRRNVLIFCQGKQFPRFSWNVNAGPCFIFVSKRGLWISANVGESIVYRNSVSGWNLSKISF